MSALYFRVGILSNLRIYPLAQQKDGLRIFVCSYLKNTAQQLSLFKVIDGKLLRLYHYNTTLATQIEFTKGIIPDSIYENLSELIPPSEVT